MWLAENVRNMLMRPCVKSLVKIVTTKTILNFVADGKLFSKFKQDFGDFFLEYKARFIG